MCTNLEPGVNSKKCRSIGSRKSPSPAHKGDVHRGSIWVLMCSRAGGGDEIFVVFDFEGSRVLLEDLDVGGLRLVTENKVITRLKVSTIFWYVLFGDEMPQHCSQPAASCSALASGESSRS